MSTTRHVIHATNPKTSVAQGDGCMQRASSGQMGRNSIVLQLKIWVKCCHLKIVQTLRKYVPKVLVLTRTFSGRGAPAHTGSISSAGRKYSRLIPEILEACINLHSSEITHR